eukprot:TRINITY_DN136_c0_g1_i2.p1 TRINITY_DN136_c0_g1~~TRINITY_DN136_c0_g1_i2.p1  ORF type:complete len:382 (-),score=96.39 TRINITY_DN136_c0_g1_i2:157-1143(-)
MFNNLKSKMQVATQMAKEKMGKADQSVESEDVRSVKTNLKTIKKGYKQINHSGKAYVSESEKLAMTTNELGDALLSLGSGILTSTSLGSGLHTLGTQLKTMSSVTQNYNAATNTNLVGPIGKLLDVDIKRASDIKKRQEMARLRYDSAISSVKSHKGGKAEEELEIARQSYEQTTRELNEALTLILAEIGNTLMVELKSWANSQAQYYREMSELWTQVENQLAPLPTSASVTTTTTVLNAYVPQPTPTYETTYINQPVYTTQHTQQPTAATYHETSTYSQPGYQSTQSEYVHTESVQGTNQHVSLEKSFQQQVNLEKTTEQRPIEPTM